MGFTVSRRVFTGFGIIIFFLICISVYSIYGVSSIVENANEVIEGNKLKSIVIQREVDHLNWAMGLNRLITDKNVHKFKGGVDCKKCKFGKWLYGEGREKAEYLTPKLRPLIDSIEPVHRKLHESASKIISEYRQADESLPKFFAQKETDHYKWVLALSNYMNHISKELDIELSHKKCSFGKFLHGNYAKKLIDLDPEFMKLLNAIKKPHQLLHESAVRVKNLVESGDISGAKDYFIKNSTKNLKNVGQFLNKLIKHSENNIDGLKKARTIYMTETIPALKAVQKTLKSIVKTTSENVMTDREMLRSAMKTKVGNLVLGVISVILGIVFSFLITRSINLPLIRIGSSIKEAAKQVTSASSELSGASQQIAEASNNQASSIEETSASIEELTGMVKANEQSANKSSDLSLKVSDIVRDGGESVKELVESMKEILESNNKIEELVFLIKTIGEKTAVIDEIVFQTKLLSFNASVEAERAGEHGRGFAIVAQEVGNLAQMSGKAALEISDIVRKGATSAEVVGAENRKKVESGNTLVMKTAEILKNVEDSSSAVRDSSQQILSSSKEQSIGISQINQAVSELDKSVQLNAATSEETASSSEELNAQAESLSGIVNELLSMITSESRVNNNNKKSDENC